MTTPTPHKPVALAELPAVAVYERGIFWETGKPALAEGDVLTLHAEATRLVADFRDENERLRETFKTLSKWALIAANTLGPEQHEVRDRLYAALAALAALKEKSA